MNEYEKSDSNMNIQEKLTFSKKKMFTYYTYKWIETTMELNGDNIHIYQSVKRIFRKEYKTEFLFSIDDIKSVQICIEMDFWDTLYAFIFLIFSFFNPVFLILTVLFVYCGYGKVIKVEKKDRSNVNIPMEKQTEDAERFIKYCETQSGNISLNKGEKNKSLDGKKVLGIIAIIAIVVAAFWGCKSLRSVIENNTEENMVNSSEREDLVSSYLNVTIEEIERNVDQYAGEKIHLEAKFTVLLGDLEIWANNSYIDVEYDGTAYDVNGNKIGSVIAGDEGYVEGSVEIYDNGLGNKDFRINADRVVITSDVGNDTYSQSENEKTNDTEDSSATTSEYTIYGYYMAQNGDEIYLNDSSEVSDNGIDFVAEMSVLSGTQYQWSGYIADMSANPIQVLSKSEKVVALITPAEDGIFVEFYNNSNSQKVWYNKAENEVTDQNVDSFIGAMGQYISTSGGTENYVNMEIYDSGNDSINITFKSMTHNGVVSAQGKITGSDTVEADWNNVHFTLEWTDAGNVLVTREGSTGYSDFDNFTEYETFINNSYYQVG